MDLLDKYVPEILEFAAEGLDSDVLTLADVSRVKEIYTEWCEDGSVQDDDFGFVEELYDTLHRSF